MADFYNDVYKGKCGERLVIAALQNNNHIVEDVSDDWNYRWVDIDLKVSKNGLTTTLEIKNDIASEITGNFFIEYYNSNNKEHHYKGWYKYTETEWICFLQEKSRIARIVKMEDLRRLVKEGKWKCRRSSNAEGFLIPVAAVDTLPSLYRLYV